MGIIDRAKKAAQVQGAKANNLTWDGTRGWSIVRGTSQEDLPDNFNDYVLEAFRRNPVVAACIREIQTSISEAPIRVYRPNENGEDALISDHPLSELFQVPNDRDSYVTFIERSVQHFILGGNSFWRKRRNGAGVTVSLLPIRPDRIVGADVNDDGFPVSFEYRKGKNLDKTESIPFDDIVHIPDADPLNEVFGMPRVMAATLDIATDNEASNYVNEVLGNYGSPGTIVTIDGERAKRQMLERAEELWQEKFGPGRGRGKVAFIPGGQQVQQIGFNLRDLEFEKLRQVTRESICAAIGVDPMVVNISTASRGGTLSGSEHQEARRKLWTQTLIPMLRRWEAAINAFLSSEFGDVIARFDLSDVAALQKDRTSQVERARKMVQSGASIEEARAEMDLDPEPDKDHHFILSGKDRIESFESIQAGGTADEEVNSEEDSDNGNGSDDGTEESDPEGSSLSVGERIDRRTPEAKPLPNATDDESEEEFIDRCMGNAEMVEDFPDNAQRRAVCQDLWEDSKNYTRMLQKSIRSWMEDNPVRPIEKGEEGVRISAVGSVVEDHDMARKQVEGFARSQEITYRYLFEDFFEMQKQEITRLAFNILRDHVEASADGPSETKQGTDPRSIGEFNVRLNDRFSDYDRELERQASPLMQQTAAAVAIRLSSTVGVVFNQFDPFVSALLDDRLSLLKDANRETRDAISAAIKEAVEEGAGRLELVDRIRKIFDEGYGYTANGERRQIAGNRKRAALIAATETTEITNGAALAMMQNQTIIPWTKLWLSMRDNKVRPEHQMEDEDSHEDPVPLDEPFRVTGRSYPGGFNCRCVVLFEQPKNDPLDE